MYKSVTKWMFTNLLIFSQLFFSAAVASDQNQKVHTSQLKQHVSKLVKTTKTENTPVTVIFEGVDLPVSIRQLIKTHKGEIRYQKGKSYEIRIPAARLNALLKRMPNNIHVRLPYPYQSLVTSQGVNIMGAEDMHALSNLGSGVKVGVIDLGFTNYTTAQAAGELPVSLSIVDYTGTGSGGSNHGTSVAEIVHDMAPGAELYLAKVNTLLQLDAAVNDMISAGVRVINHSVGWFGAAFYDGTGDICAMTNTAQSAGLLWVNAMGNSRTAHYLDTFTDSDADLRHDFSASPLQNHNTIDLFSGAPVTLILNWDAYPTTRDIDYNLYLYDHPPTVSSVPVASSEDPQRRPYNIPPLEILSYTPSLTGTHYIVVSKTSTTTANVPFTLFSNGRPLGTKTLASSMPQPADCAAVMSVGAVDLDDTAEYFSSEGPTTDGRNKPEVSATNRNPTSQTASFVGTSGSSPHVAGAAALLLSQNPSLTLLQLNNSLINQTHDVHSSGYDFRTGHGRISLDADLDGINHDLDNCVLVPNTDQADLDNDGLGNVCDDDIDGDGLSNSEEVALGTEPEIADTDLDGLNDGDEVNIYNSNPILPDSDFDGLNDGDEVNLYGTDPNVSNQGDLAPKGAPDDQLNVADLLMLYRYIGNLDSPSAVDLVLGDINKDGSLNVLDALALRQSLGY